MDFAEFQKMLLDSLRDDNIKSQFLKLLSDDGVAAEIERYENLVKELEEKLAKSSKEAEEKYSSLLSEFNDLSGTSAAVKLESENKDKRIAELDSAKIASDRIARLTNEVDSLRNEAGEKDKRIAELTASENYLKAQLTASSSAADDMRKQLESTGSEKDSEIGRLNEKLAAVTSEFETVKAQNEADKQKAQNDSAEIERLKKENEEAAAQLAEAEKNAASAK